MKKIFTNVSLIAIVFAILLGSNVQNTNAQSTIEPPVSLRAELIVEKTVPPTNIAHLIWNPNIKGEKATGYNVYLGYSGNGQIQYKLYTSLKVAGGEKEFVYDFKGLSPAIYYFKVTSTYIDSKNIIVESNPSETKLQINGDTPPPTDYIKFTNKFDVLSIKVGEKLTIKLETSSNRTDCKVLFNVKSQNSPDEFSYKIVGNLLTIWSDKDGKKFLNINASLDCNPNIMATATIYGIIGDPNSNGGGSTDYVKFTSPLTNNNSPYINASPDKQFTLQFKAETNLNCPIKYILEEVQSTVKNYKFDAASGYLSFTPTKDMQWVSIVVTAVATCNEKVRATNAIKIQILNETPTSTSYVYGSVIDQDKNPIKQGNVQLWSISKVANGLEPVYNATIQDGKYYFSKVPAPAEYRVKVDAAGYASMWYDGVDNIGKAKTIKVDVNGKVVVDFVLTKLPEPKKHTITGSVVNEAGEPVMAYIVFVSAEQIFKGNNSKSANNNLTLTTKTDANGLYSIQVPENLTLVAYVKEMLNNSTSTPKYLLQYYNEVENPMESDIIFVADDISDINFKLKLLPTKKVNGFAGVVKNEKGEPLVSNLIAIKIGSTNSNNNKSITYSTVSDAKGNFTFKGIEFGEYVVLSMPNDKTYVPGYIKLNDIVSMKWKEASRISVNDAMNQVVYEAIHKAVVKKPGIGGIIGYVNNAKGVFDGKNNSSQANVAVTGALVYITDNNGNIVDYSFTEKSGNFAINELTDGVYNLVSDAYGFNPVFATVVVDYIQNPIAKSDITMIEDASLKLSIDLISDQSDINIFPMPVSINTSVLFEASLNSAKIEVLTAQGNVVFSNTMSTTLGQNKFMLNTEKLANGVYFIIIDNGLSAKAKSFVISK